MSQVLQQLKSFKILLIGDSCMDVFKYGVCTRLSPEAPVPVFNYKHEICIEGMAGNVRNNLIPFGVTIDYIGSNSRTKKIRYVEQNSGYHLMREDIEFPTDRIRIDEIQHSFYDAVIISDYDKGFLAKDDVDYILSIFKCPIFVDSKKTDLSCYENCIIKINEKEFQRIEKLPRNCELIVTLGSLGARFNNEIIPSYPVQAFDVSGAGDTFIASLVIKFLLTNNLRDSIKFANFCSSRVVQKIGTSAIQIEEVYNELCL